MVKWHVHGHNHATNHGKCCFVSRDTYEYVNCVVAMALVCIRPNGGAKKQNPLLGFWGHTTHSLILVYRFGSILF